MQRRAIPILFIVLGVWLLSGCFTIPTFEHSADGDKDYRDLLGDKNSKRPIRAGAITRAKIIARLGEPRLFDPAGTAVGYEYTGVRSVMVFPLCFSVIPSDQTRYSIRFDFDGDEVLTGWRTEEGSSRRGGMMFGDLTQWTSRYPTLGLQYRPRKSDQFFGVNVLPTTQPVP